MLGVDDRGSFRVLVFEVSPSPFRCVFEFSASLFFVGVDLVRLCVYVCVQAEERSCDSQKDRHVGTVAEVY